MQGECEVGWISRPWRLSLTRGHQWIAWLPGLRRVCSRARMVFSSWRRPSSSPEDRISRSIWVISLSSSIDLRRSADLPIAPFFVSIVYVREWESKTHTRKKSLEIRGFSQAIGRQSDKPSRRNCQLMALSEDDGSEGQTRGYRLPEGQNANSHQQPKRYDK